MEETEEFTNEYAQEAEARWGHTYAFKQSVARVKKMGNNGINAAKEKSNAITQTIAKCMKDGLAPTDKATQKIISEHYNWLRNFYEPNLELYKGLAKMYVEDARFKANYDKVAPGLAEYMRDSMLAFADNK